MKKSNAVIYSIFVRNHTEKGDFLSIIPDLDRIKSLGVDIIWLLPIYPIGEKARKGEGGSPYAIRDYRGVNPEFGTREDLIKLVDAIHERGMKCIVDIVYNHTSPDSWLVENHPEYFFRNEKGEFGNKIADWSDIIDLDYDNEELWDYQIETLKQWAQIFDGFRCDVAPMVPVDFWVRAHDAVEEVRPDAIWLAESGHPSFITELRAKNCPAGNDTDLYRAFDMCYEYDSYPFAMKCYQYQCPAQMYADLLNIQEGSLPADAIKMRFLENHDNSRIRESIKDEKTADNWTAMLYFEKGASLIYEGQEVSATHRPSIFDQEPVDWNAGRDISDLLRKLYQIKKNERLEQRPFVADGKGQALILSYGEKGNRALGWFCMQGRPELVETDLPDGSYKNELTGEAVAVEAGVLKLTGDPVIVFE